MSDWGRATRWARGTCWARDPCTAIHTWRWLRRYTRARHIVRRWLPWCNERVAANRLAQWLDD